MSFSKQGRGGKRRGYHHGNLREALVAAAMELIGEHGLSGFTFADAARAAGVSAAAPYRHFNDRDALIAAVAQRGFEQFAEDLAAAWNGGRPDAMTALKKVGHAYLGFARIEPAYYTAMFESGLPPDLDPDLTLTADRAFNVIVEVAEAVVGLLPPVRRPPPRMVALHLWTQAHGIASLFARGDAARRKLPMAPEDLLEAETLIYFQGLGFGAPLDAPLDDPVSG